jgi:hypothetical protein
MKLDFIDLGKLSISKANMRYAKKRPTWRIFCRPFARAVCSCR